MYVHSLTAVVDKCNNVCTYDRWTNVHSLTAVTLHMTGGQM